MTDQPYLGPDTGADKGPNVDVDYNKIIIFDQPPEVIPFRDDNQLDDTLYYTRCAHQYTTFSGLVITVPADYHTDLLSIPRIGWSVLGLTPGGCYDWAAIIHDDGYGLQGKFPNGITLTRKQVDDILLEILTRLNMPWLKRKAVYLAVRLFGATHWKGN